MQGVGRCCRDLGEDLALREGGWCNLEALVASSEAGRLIATPHRCSGLRLSGATQFGQPG